MLALQLAQSERHGIEPEPGSARQLIHARRLPSAGPQDAGRVADRLGAAGRCPPSAPRAGSQAERDKDVVGIEERLRAVGEERVAARGRRIAARSRHHEHGAVVVEGPIGRDAGAALERRLDDDHDVGESEDFVRYWLMNRRRVQRPRESDVVVGVYARISDDRDGFAHGVERQLEDCRTLCERRGWNATEYVENDVSASRYSTKRRVEFERMVGDLKVGAITGLVAWDTDRLYRQVTDLENLLVVAESLPEFEFATVTSGGGAIDLRTPQGRMFARHMCVQAAYESEHKSERIRRQKQQAAELGKWMGGSRPFGFAVESDGALSVIDEEADLIRDAASRLLTGMASCRGIAAEWNAKGVLTPRGSGWYSQVLRKMLLRPSLAGYSVHNGEIVGDARWKSVLDRETWNSLRRMLLAPERITNSGVSARVHTLAGFVFCSRCGLPMTSGLNNGKRAFKCKKGQRPGNCGGLSIMMEPLDRLTREIVLARFFLAGDSMLKVARARARKKSKVSARAVGKLDSLRVRMQEVEDMFTNGEITRAQFHRMSERLREQQDSAAAQLDAATEARLLQSLPVTVEDLESTWDDGSLDERRALLGLVVERFEILPAPHRGARFTRDRVRPLFRNLGSNP